MITATVVNRSVRPAAPRHYTAANFKSVPLDVANKMAEVSSRFDTRIELGTFWSMNESHNGKMCFAYVMRNRQNVPYGVRAVVETGESISTYAVADENAMNECLDMLRKCHGRNYDEFELVAENRTSANANDLYKWEAETFGVYGSDYRAAHEVAHVSFEEAKRRFNYGRKSTLETNLITKAEAIDLIQRVAREYRLVNLTVEWSTFSGANLGVAIRRGHLVERVKEMKVDLKESTLTDATVLHEMAHLIDYARDGESGHGNRFRATYEKLLRDYLGLDVTIERLPKEGAPVIAIAAKKTVEKEPEPEFKMPEDAPIKNPVDLDW